MKFTKRVLLNALAVAFNLKNQLSYAVSESELKNFKYGKDEFTLNIIGDTGATKEATQVMNLASFDALLHLGDYDYECVPDSYFSKILSSSRKYKFFGVLGNHESVNECGETKYKKYIDLLYSQMTGSKNSGTSCVFSPKKTMWSCVYKNMRIIGLSPYISKDEKRSDQLNFLKKYLSESNEDWKICAWHYYDDYYHTGKYIENENFVSGTGESFYDYCRSHGAIIFSAHDHVYARTHVMTKFSTPKIDSYDYDSPSNIVQIREGATLDILNGVGGWEIYIERDKYKNYSHWQKKYARGDSSENAKKYGTLICKFNVGGNNKKAYCEMLRINSDPKVFDSFTIYRNDDPKNVKYDQIDSKFLKEKTAAYEKSKGNGGSGGSSNTSTSGRCGSEYGKCPNNLCCSKYGWCNSSSDHCDINKGCQPKYGICNSASGEVTKISTNGRCGSEYGKCPKDYCCSKYGWCNTTKEHCDVDHGCQAKYGSCKKYTTVTTKKSTTTKKTTTKKTTTIGYSSSGKCGKDYGKCKDSKCCSKYGWCGTDSNYCSSGCQKDFGKCW